jgi:hypothetical protein
MNEATAPANGNHPSPYAGEESAATRNDQLAAATARVKVRRGGNVPVEQILLVSACVLFPAGIALILLGWSGAAHTGHLYEQIDYLISGGLLGVALAIAGGFMYFGYWLSRQLNESRRQNALTLQYIQRLEQAVSGNSVRATAQPLTYQAPEARSDSNGEGRRRRRSTSAGPSEDVTGELPVPLLVATPRGSLLHRPECPVVAGRTGLRPMPADAEGFGYCTMCDAAGAAGAAATDQSRRGNR